MDMFAGPDRNKNIMIAVAMVAVAVIAILYAAGRLPESPEETEGAASVGGRVARVWKISRASVYRSLKQTPPTTITCRPGPVGACSDAELADHIRLQIDASRLHGEGYRKLWARLRFAGVRASPRRVRRVMRETGLLAPHRVGRTAAKPHDGTITTDKVNEMWGTDMTQTITIREGRGNVFVAVEHANSEVVGIHASWSAFPDRDIVRHVCSPHFIDLVGSDPWDRVAWPRCIQRDAARASRSRASPVAHGSERQQSAIVPVRSPSP